MSMFSLMTATLPTLYQFRSNPRWAMLPLSDRKDRILIINAVNIFNRECAQTFLIVDHIGQTVTSYKRIKDEPGFNRFATLEEVRAKDDNLTIPLYVATVAMNGRGSPLAREATDSDLTSVIKAGSLVYAQFANL